MYQFKHRCAAGDNGAKSGTDCADALRDSSSAFESAHNVFPIVLRWLSALQPLRASLEQVQGADMPCRFAMHDDVGCKDGRQIGIQTI